MGASQARGSRARTMELNVFAPKGWPRAGSTTSSEIVSEIIMRHGRAWSTEQASVGS